MLRDAIENSKKEKRDEKYYCRILGFSLKS